MFSTQNLVADEYFCLENSPECEWGAPLTSAYSSLGKVVTGVDFQWFDVHFETYNSITNPGEYCDPFQMRITSIEFYDPANFSATEEDIIKRSVLHLLYESCCIFDVFNPGVPYTVNIDLPTCWQKTYDANDVMTGFEACSDECCRHSYTVQVVNNKVRINNITNIYAGITPNDCPGGATGSNPCMFMCSAIDNIPLGPIATDEDLDEYYCEEYPTCTNDWEMPASNQLSCVLDGIPSKIYFSTRKCPASPDYLEFRIDHIIALSTSTPFDLIDSDHYADYIKDAIKELLAHSYEIFSVPCSVDVSARVRIGNCWRGNGSINTLLTPCRHSNCCVHEYALSCNLIDDEKIISLISVTDMYLNPYECNPIPDNDPYDCHEICADAGDIIPGELPRYAFINSEQVQTIERKLSYVKPNPCNRRN